MHSNWIGGICLSMGSYSNILYASSAWWEYKQFLRNSQLMQEVMVNKLHSRFVLFHSSGNKNADVLVGTLQENWLHLGLSLKKCSVFFSSSSFSGEERSFLQRIPLYPHVILLSITFCSALIISFSHPFISSASLVALNSLFHSPYSVASLCIYSLQAIRVQGSLLYIYLQKIAMREVCECVCWKS